MTTQKLNTVITIDLKEYAWLKAIKKAAQELQEDLFDWNDDMHFGAGDPTTLVSYQNMQKLLEKDYS